MIKIFKKNVAANFYLEKTNNTLSKYILGNLIEISIFILTLILLSPLLNSGFFSDDAYQSQIHGVLIERNTNLFFILTMNEGLEGEFSLSMLIIFL